MKIKYRIAVLFTLVVSFILLLLCASIFYFSNLNRAFSFRERIKNRAITTVSLLFKVSGINPNLLRRIDEITQISLDQKSFQIFNSAGNIIYSYADENVTPVPINANILLKAKEKGTYFFNYEGRDVVAVNYTDGDNSYIVVGAAFDKDGFQKLDELKLILLFSFIIGVLITFLSGLFFSERIVHPIQKITKEVKEISSQNLSRRIELKEPKDELYQLSYTFNDLMNRLQESFEIQRRFIANASHELSTPLTAISSQLEITMQNERTADEYKAVISSVYDDVKNLNQLTRSLLEIAKASGTSDGIELSLVRIDELLMRLPVELRKTNAAYNVQLHFDTFPENEDKLLVFGNNDLLFSAIKNIVTNACKYSPDHTANVSLSFSDYELYIIVKDNGPGISQKDLDLIFQPFYRGEEAENKHGFGLGLPLALRIIKMHKGNITIKSTVGQGSQFTIVLPIGRSFHLI
ncbi:sensor histidine kinase [Hydrotalea sandarakina]|jgi:signal transduction histidine kinase|uniref:histidine kinase n=1 Tax=Hydrotalea sandarakina TaxID=1004304 RepID=A0A2W7RSB4_9BACT|nr:HAMP domain-containing sensor histidine kinase [Hydrotalea sandarakina]PZX61786.1 signal transduction histidine kinase [Hydrotalea sandarakina]